MMPLKPYSHERHEIARHLGAACDCAQELGFFLSNKPRRFRDLGAGIKRGDDIDAREIETAARRIRKLSVETLEALRRAHALASIFSGEDAA